MNDSILDVAVIGAGHAGLSISYYLKQLGLRHLVFEQGTIGNSWGSQRWKSFKLNTANKINLLPGMEMNFADPDGFCSALEFVASLNDYAKKFELPALENNTVLSVEKDSDTEIFLISVTYKGKTSQYQSKKVVIASGSQNKENIPSFAVNILTTINQLHAGKYRNAEALPSGVVLVVGSGQSGVQIAEDLVDSGRKVYMSTSMVARAPRRYRGKDIFDWLDLIGFFDHKPEDLPDPQMLKMKQPQVSGVGSRGKTISLQALAEKGVIILGKLDNINGDHVDIQANAADHVKFGDSFSNKVKSMIDEYINKAQLEAPVPSVESADLPDENADCISSYTSINLSDHNITSIIWTTGFIGDFSYLKLPVFSDDGTLKYKNGISEIDGLYFLGFPWLRKRKSGIVFGIDEDAKFISEKILELR